MNKLRKWTTATPVSQVKVENVTPIVLSDLSTTGMIQNFHLVWLDGNIDIENNEDSRNYITKLRQFVNTINIFNDIDKCINFINGIKEEKTFIISSGTLGEQIVPVLHDKSQVNAIYIFCCNKIRHEKWTKEWFKIKNVYTDITSICEELKQAVQDCDHNSISISFTKTTDNTSVQRLDQSFVYTQILKDILLTIDFEENHLNQFLTYCRTKLTDNTIELKNVEKIEKKYRDHQPIWWYTYKSFLYSMLNRAFRFMEIDLIHKMGFFIRDLHNNITELHREQYSGKNHSDSFIVYYGQGLSQTDFNQLKNTQGGGLLSFHNFLFTSKDQNVSLKFVRRTIHTSDLIGVIFIMKIDPSISTTPFANVQDVVYYETQEKEEILFSIYSVFRIGQIKQIDGNNRLYQVELTLISNNDLQLHNLTKQIHELIFSTAKGWYRLGYLLVQLAQFNQAQQLFDIILEQTIEQGEKANIYHLLGMVKFNQGKYVEALQFYEKSIQINEQILPSTHSRLSDSYNNIGLVYESMGQYSKALLSHEKALEIKEKSLSTNHPLLTQSYNNIGSVYDNMGHYCKALSYYKKALEIDRINLPENHSSLSTSYNNIGSLYKNVGQYSRALSYYEKALEIDQQITPIDHSSLATSYNNIGSVYDDMGDYKKALSYYEKTLEIEQQILSGNHPDLAISYNNIGSVYDSMGEYTKALSNYEKALEIREKSLHENHPSLAISYNNIGNVYNNINEYSKALSNYEKALEIWKKTLSENHPNLACSYGHLGMVYFNIKQHSKAILYCEQALNILQISLPYNHPDIQLYKNNLEHVKNNL